MSLNQLPTNWERAKLSEVSLVIQGQSPPGHSYNADGVGLPFLQGKAQFGSTSPTPDTWCSAPIRLAEPGDILISIRAPVGPTNLADQRYCIGRGLAAIRTPPQVSPSFLLYYLRHSVSSLVDQATGTTFDAIGGDVLRAHSVLVPPIAEQRRIVEAIDSYLTRLDDAVASLERVQRKLKAYRASVLKAAVEGRLVPTEASLARAESRDYESAAVLLARIVNERRRRWVEAELAKFKTAGKTPKGDKWKASYEEPVAPDTRTLPELPEGWSWASIEQLASDEARSIQSGPFGSNLLHSEFQHEGNLVLGIDNVQDGYFSMGAEHRIRDEKFQELEQYRARGGDVLVTVMATVGRTCVIPDGLEPAIITKHVYRITPNHEVVSPSYLHLALWGGPVVREQMFGQVIGQTRPGLNGGVIRRLAIPLPPKMEQARIVEAADQLLSSRDQVLAELSTSTRRVQCLRQATLKWAIEGKLVDQDASDEPAGRLLARIRAQRAADSPAKKPPRRRGRGAA